MSEIDEPDRAADENATKDERAAEDERGPGTGEPPEGLPDVCVVTLRGGATQQNATYRLLNVLSALTAVSLVTVALAEESKIPGEYDVTEISGGTKGGGLLGTALLFVLNQVRICRAIRRSDAGLIYFFGGTAYVVPIAVAALLGRTVVVQSRGDVPLTLELAWREQYPDALARLLASAVRLLERLGLRLADAVVTYTPAMARELGLDRYEEKLYPHGTRYVDVETFRPETPFEERERRAGTIGRLDVEKGIDELGEAVGLLSEETAFVFVGDGDRREHIEDALADERAAGRVELTGWLDHDEIPAQLNRLQLLVLASEPTEGLPTIIQEAFACGTPVYATPVSGIPDVVHEGETGFLMADRRPERIAERIEAILDRDDLDEISENCRAFAVERYSFAASVERFRTLLSRFAVE